MENSYDEFQKAVKTLKLLSLSTREDLQRKYRELSKKHHPDVSGDQEKFLEIQRSYELLKEYMENFRFELSNDEFYKQNPDELMKKQFYQK